MAARGEQKGRVSKAGLAALNKELYSHIYSCRKTLRRLLTFVQRMLGLPPLCPSRCPGCARLVRRPRLVLSRYSPARPFCLAPTVASHLRAPSVLPILSCFLPRSIPAILSPVSLLFYLVPFFWLLLFGP